MFQPQRRHVIAAAIAMACGVSTVFAQTPWPSKPLKMVVGFPAGSSPDLTARTLSEPLSQALGQPVVVENKVGAGGNIAAALVARATDDHTIGLMINGNLTIAKILNPAINYDPLKDLTPVTLIATSPLVLTVPAGTTATGAAYFEAARLQGHDQRQREAHGQVDGADQRHAQCRPRHHGPGQREVERHQRVPEIGGGKGDVTDVDR